MPPSDLSSAAMSLVAMSSAPTSSAATPSTTMPPSAPLSKERRRCDLECKLLSDTVKAAGPHMPKSAKRRLSKLLKHKSANHASENARRQNDINRRCGVAELMRIRVAANVEDVRVSQEWAAIAAVKPEKYAEMEEHHRGWIIQELEARVGEKPMTWILRRDQRNRRAEALLLRDTRAMPGRGGIRWVSDSWLNHCLRRHPENLEAKEEIKAYHQARIYAVNYIAACRQDAGIQGDLETTFTHKGHDFSQIDADLATKNELESLARAELEKIHWEEDSGEVLSGDEGDEYTDEEADEGGVAIEAGESGMERMPPEPISADESGGEDEDDRMLPEPVSGGEEEDNDV